MLCKNSFETVAIADVGLQKFFCRSYWWTLENGREDAAAS